MKNPLKNLPKKATKVYNAAEGVYSFKIVFVNVIMVATGTNEETNKPNWVLIDAGLKGYSKKIMRIAAKQFGEGNPPQAIILTHGHFDHIGTLKKLLKVWDVPVYCHRLELPYLTGRSAYPPQDPTVDNGLMAMVSRVYPTDSIDLGNQVFPLPASGEVPHMPNWVWHHVPGHSPGQIALFRESDRTLISADAFVTTKQESAYAVMTQRRQINGPPAYFTIDWLAAEQSVVHLERLRPEVVISGHGRPMEGSKMRKELRTLAHNFQEMAVPEHGRYVEQPATADERGIIDVPPPAIDNLPRVLAGIGLMAMAATTSFLLFSRSKRNSSNSSTSAKETRRKISERREDRPARRRTSSATSVTAGTNGTAKRKSAANKSTTEN
ncbi:MAG: MBL fold metallo-hydrolase, partial [Sphingobacteriales bacterium]